MVIFIYNDIGLLKEVSGGLHVEWRGGGVGGLGKYIVCWWYTCEGRQRS